MKNAAAVPRFVFGAMLVGVLAGCYTRTQTADKVEFSFAMSYQLHCIHKNGATEVVSAGDLVRNAVPEILKSSGSQRRARV
jgi:hypothetical protein